MLLLHFEVETIQNIVQGKVFFSIKFRSTALFFESPEKIGDIFNVSDSLGSIVINHQ